MLLVKLIAAETVTQAPEPELTGDKVISLISEQSFKGWKVPSNRWTIKDSIITGDTAGEELKTPEWLYTTEKYADYIFSAEVKLSGSKANSGIYFRVKPFPFTPKNIATPFDAPSGYEYDAALASKYNGSLGDWYARPNLRINPDPIVMQKTFKEGDWNRMTFRAQGNRLEYWLNGIKIIDYTDNDPKGSRVGLIGIQIHDKIVMKVHVKNAFLLPLADAVK